MYGAFKSYMISVHFDLNMLSLTKTKDHDSTTKGSHEKLRKVKVKIVSEKDGARLLLYTTM